MSHKNLKEYLNKKCSPELASLVESISIGCIEIAQLINEGPILGILGGLNQINAQGETQQELDYLSNQVMMAKLKKSPYVAQIVSEEDEEVQETNHKDAPYLVAIDPLDGSSNIKVNISVGTIFMITRNHKDGFFQTGRDIVLSGYAIYGSSNQLVLCYKDEVNFFTLNPKALHSENKTITEFLLTKKNIRIEAETSEFAINMSNQRIWDKSIQTYINDCQNGKSGPFNKSYNTRWVGSMVAEIHRILNRGGVFLYPTDSRFKEIGGRLRLLYEGFPMAHIVEVAGGLSSTGICSILDVKPKTIHQRIPVILGSKNEVEVIENYVKKLDSI